MEEGALINAFLAAFLSLKCWWNINRNILQKSVIGDNTIGYNVLHTHSLPSGDYWYWIGVGALLLYSLLFNSVVTLALAYLNRKLQEEVSALCFYRFTIDFLIICWLLIDVAFPVLFITALRKSQVVIDDKEENSVKSQSSFQLFFKELFVFIHL